MKIAILNIGDELLAGKILNSNQFDLSRMVRPLGHEVHLGLVLGDRVQTIIETLAWVLKKHPIKSDVLVITGGLGPTQDDLTREAVAKFIGCPLIEDSQALEWLCTFIGKPLNELGNGQRIQANIPSLAEPLRNPVGTACGFRFQIDGVWVFAFPGVPSELRAMAKLYLLPVLTQAGVLLEKGLWTYGFSEGSQAQAFAKLGIKEPFLFSSLPNEKGVRISLSCMVPADQESRYSLELDRYWQALMDAIPPQAIVDREGASLTEFILKRLIAGGKTVSIAESCTGGGLGALLTELPGSSRIFHKGFLTYSNQAKMDMLGVDPETLSNYGAVSEETILAMVSGCLIRSGSDYACAITGIAGPDGGTEDKPVGTVWIAVAYKGDVNSPAQKKAVRFNFRGNRTEVRSRSCYSALNQLRLIIEN